MKKATIFVMLMTISMIGCSPKEAYDKEAAVDRGDVVVDYFQDRVYNFETFERFIQSISSGKEDAIRLTSYTLEGDPIFQDVQFDGKGINYSYNNSYDQFGGDDRGIETDVCEGIIKEENEKGEADYLLTGCSEELNENRSIIRVDETRSSL
ncbi:DUF4362 domain-containing protein [Bacillus sp. FSL W7-1360]